MIDAVGVTVLDQLEALEGRLLSWGAIDGSFTSDEFREAIESAIDEINPGGATVGAVAAWMHANGLVLRVASLDGARRYRTRMGETVRLAAQLRQLFPRHVNNLAWMTAPTLVADYRFARRTRRYPRRSITPDDAIEVLRAGLPTGDPRPDAAYDLLMAIDTEVHGQLRLARFQLDAATRVLRALGKGRTAATIVSAGTGSGKTLAFYLPAFAHVCQLIQSDARPWTKVVAIYPRQELLADQFSEAYVQARRLDASLLARGARHLVLGAFFGKVPLTASAVLPAKGGWKRKGDDRECPFLRCPNCRALMVWRRADIDAGKEVLACPRIKCGHVTPDGALVLTRTSQQTTPPDVLFTITESLNNQLGNRFQQSIFGVHARRPPHLVLLDEVHTYEGTHGAHVALLLRRWRHAVGGPMHFVGLSATLRDATQFMSELTGVRHADVVGIEPRTSDMVDEGREYLLALRGDPMSSSSLLSTTIQTVMLLGRVLDPPDHPTSGGLYGQRAFAFTDDLDVTNRLFDQLCDAEAVGRNGHPFRRQGGSLANLRATVRGWLRDDPDDQRERRMGGQLWDVCESVGHVLEPGQPLVVGRTSSQDPGVDDRASVIVATASLEVGFDDPRVGAVLQHKAPHDAARFLQRKGRAGRTRKMRPWTVVVLSDYGRDRLAYQGYDLLFDPQLAPRHLAVRNRHVLRMQATFATMDWLSDVLGQAMPRNKGRIMDDLGGPPRDDYARARQDALARAIRQVLSHDSRRQELATHLRKALGISADEVEPLLWEPPRALMTATLPTLLRRLESRWRRSSVGGVPALDSDEGRQSAPEFIPRALFADLNLPEARIELPPNHFGDLVDPEYLPVSQALRELAPGRVTRRFGVEHSQDRHWLAPGGLDNDADERDLAVEALFPLADQLDPVHAVVSGQTRVLPCIRPRVVVATQPPDDVRSSSHAVMDWHTEVLAPNGGDPLPLVAPSAWRFARPRLAFHTASGGTALDVRRFSLGARAEIAIERGVDRSLASRFVAGDALGVPEQVAVGFVVDADGLALTLELPDPLAPPGGLHADLPAARRAYLGHRIAIHRGLDGVANDFQRQWLAEIYLAAVLENAIRRSLRLQAAHEELLSGDLAGRLAAVMDAIFQTLPASEEEPGGDPQAGATRQSLHETLIELFAEEAVRSVLADVAPVLWSAPDADWRQWALERCRATLAAAALDACQILCPDFDVEGLVVDLDAGPRAADPDRIYITETTIGGGGVVEEVARRITLEPRRFFDLMRARLGPSDFEVVDAELGRLLDELPVSPALTAALDAVRGAVDHASMASAQDALMQTLSAHDYFVCHPVMAALNARLLRPGATSGTDDLLREMRNTWIEWEADLEVEIDLRVAAYLLAADTSLSLPTRPPADPAHRRQWRSNVMSGLLWPRGGQVRASAVELRNPYARLPDGDRMLVSHWLGAEGELVKLAQGWAVLAREVLARDGVVVVHADRAERMELAIEAAGFVAEPVEIEHLHLFPHVAGIRRWHGRYELRIQLRYSPA